MQMQAMEASIHNELLEGEELLWSGRSDPQKRRVVSPGRVFLILGSIFLPVGILLILLGLLLSFSLGAALELIFFIPGGVFSLLGILYLIIGQIGFSPSSNELYAITNRRVIVVRLRRYTIASSYDRQAIRQVHRIERPDGSGDLIFSISSHFGNYGNSQYNAGIGRPGAFYAIANVRLVEQKLLGMLNES